VRSQPYGNNSTVNQNRSAALRLDTPGHGVAAKPLSR